VSAVLKFSQTCFCIYFSAQSEPQQDPVRDAKDVSRESMGSLQVDAHRSVAQRHASSN
jgi:hypothetical protein